MRVIKKSLALLLSLTVFLATIPTLCGTVTSAATYVGECGEKDASGIISGNCGAYGDGVTDNVTYMLNLDTGVLTVSGTGDMVDYDYFDYYAPWYSYEKHIRKVVIENGVTHIGNLAFFGCNRLSEITIPDSVTSIGREAFSACRQIESITIPESVTFIGIYAFDDCVSAVIHCVKGSYTDNFATENNIPVEYFFNAQTLLIVRHALFIIIDYSAENDLNGDGTTNILDLIYLKKLILQTV